MLHNSHLFRSKWDRQWDDNYFFFNVWPNLPQNKEDIDKSWKAIIKSCQSWISFSNGHSCDIQFCTPYSGKSPSDDNIPEIICAVSQLKTKMVLQTVNPPNSHSFMFLACSEINRLFLQSDYWGNDQKCDLFIQQFQTTDNYTSFPLVSTLSAGITNSSILGEIILMIYLEKRLSGSLPNRWWCIPLVEWITCESH